MSKKYDCVIVGAGLYGSTVAFLLSRMYRYHVLVIDKRKHVGGNIYDEKINGINVHKYGPHIFHTSNEMVWDFINRFGKFNNFINSPLANYKDKLYSLPFNMYTFNKMWEVNEPDKARDIIESQIKEAGITNPRNLEEQAISMVGIDIYEKLVKGYTEKQWGRDCKELPPDIIKRLPVRFSYDNNYFDDVYQGIPKDGYTSIISNMLHGIDVRLGVDYLKWRETINDMADKIIYTGRIDEFFDYTYGKLEYRSLTFEEEIMSGIKNYQGNAVINYTSKDVPYTRIVEHKHFMSKEQLEKLEPFDCTIITKEYPCSTGEFSLREPYYPINDARNIELYNKYKKKAKEYKNVFFGGRLGEYKYYDMDDVIVKAMDDVENGGIRKWIWI